MATIEEHVLSLLAAALPPTVPANRIKPRGDWQNLDRPYVVHFPVAVDPIYTHGGRAALTPWPAYQVNVVTSGESGVAYSQAATIARAIVAALEGAHGQATFFWRGFIPLDYDADRRIQEIAVNFEVFEAV
jgi:hypothetical protein